jgi:hypothetical protein
MILANAGAARREAPCHHPDSNEAPRNLHILKYFEEYLGGGGCVAMSSAAPHMDLLDEPSDRFCHRRHSRLL